MLVVLALGARMAVLSLTRTRQGIHEGRVKVMMVRREDLLDEGTMLERETSGLAQHRRRTFDLSVKGMFGEPHTGCEY